MHTTWNTKQITVLNTLDFFRNTLRSSFSLGENFTASISSYETNLLYRYYQICSQLKPIDQTISSRNEYHLKPAQIFWLKVEKVLIKIPVH